MEPQEQQDSVKIQFLYIFLIGYKIRDNASEHLTVFLSFTHKYSSVQEKWIL